MIKRYAVWLVAVFVFAAMGISATSAQNHLLDDGDQGGELLKFPPDEGKNHEIAGIGGSGTTGYVAKFTSSTNVGNSIIYESNGSLGIGTATPGKKIDVLTTGVGEVASLRLKATQGNAELTLDAYNSTNAISRVTFADNGTNLWALGMPLSGTNRDFKVYDWDAAQTRLTIDAANGNVGLGIDTPQDRLHLGSGSVRVDTSTDDFSFGDIGLSGVFAFKDLSSPNGQFRFVGSDSSAYAQIAMGYEDTYFALNNRSVGIGTSAPQAKLHVLAGDAQVPGALRIENPSAGEASLQLKNTLGQYEFINNAVTNALELWYIPAGQAGANLVQLNAFKLATLGKDVGVALCDYLVESPDCVVKIGSPTESVSELWGNQLRVFNDGIAGIVVRNTTDDSEGSFRAKDDGIEITASDDSAAPLRFFTGTANPNTGVEERMTITWNTGQVGIGTSSPAGIVHVKDRWSNLPALLLEDSDGDAATEAELAWDDNDDLRIGGWNLSTNQFTPALSIEGNTRNVGIGTTDPDRTLDVAGTSRSQVVEITGGSDLAEPFRVHGIAQPGMAVVADPRHPGEARLATKPYDTAVIGVVSGANGVKPGLIMQQEGSVANGTTPIAVAGRVYALVDASRGSVKIGDLLTTSSTPGHLMVAADRDRASGAIVGKALTALERGKGYVLMLVTLQ